MDINECMEFVRKNSVCFFATSEDRRPRVRPLAVWLADESGFYFDVPEYKEVYKQLEKNPCTEVCFHSPAEKRVLRISGRVEFVKDPEIRKRFFGGKEDNPEISIFRIKSGEAMMWWRDADGKSHKESVCF